MAGEALRAGASTSVVRRALLGVEVFSGLNAVAGGVGLIVNGLGIPKDQLAGTPFDSFLVPGLLLSLVVGGSMLGAARAVWTRHPRAGLVSMGAGGIMLGWIAVESVMIHDGRPLQVTIAALALVTLALGWWLDTREAAAG
jgi:hypothetical protein